MNSLFIYILVVLFANVVFVVWILPVQYPTAYKVFFRPNWWPKNSPVPRLLDVMKQILCRSINYNEK